jgi:membrane-associated phospholipid phosphatase
MLRDRLPTGDEAARPLAARRVHLVRRNMNQTQDIKRTCTAALAMCIAAARIAAAQTPDSATQKTFFIGRDGVYAGAALAISAGLSVLDASIERNFRDTTNYHVRVGEKLDNVFTHINETTLTVGGLVVYAVARFTDHRTIADVMFHGAEAVASASLTSQVIRGPLGRTRPENADRPYENQYDFHFLKGFTHFEQRAFPSIHSASGFAMASALVAEVKRRDPQYLWYVAVPAYALALTPGLSRMYLGEHWASDIVSGAFIGTFYGWRIVDYSHQHPTTPVDRIFLGTVEHLRVGASPSGASMSWSTPF